MAEKRPLTDLATWRANNGLSRAEFAARVGISTVQLGRWETGERQVDPRKVDLLARLTGLRRSYLRPDIAVARLMRERPTHMVFALDGLNAGAHTRQLVRLEPADNLGDINAAQYAAKGPPSPQFEAELPVKQDVSVGYAVTQDRLVISEIKVFRVRHVALDCPLFVGIVSPAPTALPFLLCYGKMNFIYLKLYAVLRINVRHTYNLYRISACLGHPQVRGSAQLRKDFRVGSRGVHSLARLSLRALIDSLSAALPWGPLPQRRGCSGTMGPHRRRHHHALPHQHRSVGEQDHQQHKRDMRNAP